MIASTSVIEGAPGGVCVNRFLKVRYLLLALAALLYTRWVYFKLAPRARAAHYLASSGLPPVPETARYLVLRGAGIASTTGVSFVDTRDNIQRWLAASEKPPKPPIQTSAQDPDRDLAFAICNDDGSSTSIQTRARGNRDDRQVQVETSEDWLCEASVLQESRPLRTTRFWALGDEHVLRVTRAARATVDLSTDGGANWRRLALDAEKIVLAARRGNRLWVATDNQIHISTDHGQSFTTLSVQTDAASSPPDAGAGHHVSTAGRLVPESGDGVFLVNRRRILRLDGHDQLHEHWHLPTHVADGVALVALAVHPDGRAIVTAGSPAALFLGRATGGALVEDQLGFEPPKLKSSRSYKYLRVENTEFVLAPSVEAQDASFVPPNEPRGCSLFRRTLGEVAWRNERPSELESGISPEDLVAFDDGSGCFLVVCGAPQQLFVADLALHLRRITLPDLEHTYFADPAPVGGEIWFGIWNSRSHHTGVAIRSDGSHRYLD